MQNDRSKTCKDADQNGECTHKCLFYGESARLEILVKFECYEREPTGRDEETWEAKAKNRALTFYRPKNVSHELVAV